MNRAAVAALVGGLVACVAIRLYGIRFGLPALNDPDEPVFVSSALRMLRTHSLNPGWFGHPGTTTIYLLSASYALLFAAGRATHVFADVGSFAEAMRADPSLLYLVGRITIVLSAAATVYVVFELGRRLFGPWVGITGAWLLAIDPVHVRYSQLIRTDVQLGAVAVLLALVALRIAESGERRHYVVAGLLTGVAVATKWPGVMTAAAVFVAFLVATNLSRQRMATELPKLVLSAGAAVVGLLLISPFLALDARTTLRDLALEGEADHVSANGHGWLANLWWYVTDPLVLSLSVAGLLLAVVGIVDACRRDFRRHAVALAFPVAFLVFIAALSLRWERWIVPVLPFLSVYAAAGLFRVASLAETIAARRDLKIAVPAGAMLAWLVAVPLAGRTMRGAEERSHDTRTLAGEWLLDHVPTGSRVLMETYAPQLPRDAYVFFGVGEDGQLEAATPSAWTLFLPFGQVGRLKDVDTLDASHIDFVVLSNWLERYGEEEARYSKEVRTYRRLLSEATEIYKVERVRGVIGGPTIRILQLQHGSGRPPSQTLAP